MLKLYQRLVPTINGGVSGLFSSILSKSWLVISNLLTICLCIVIALHCSRRSTQHRQLIVWERMSRFPRPWVYKTKLLSYPRHQRPPRHPANPALWERNRDLGCLQHNITYANSHSTFAVKEIERKRFLW